MPLRSETNEGTLDGRMLRAEIRIFYAVPAHALEEDEIEMNSTLHTDEIEMNSPCLSTLHTETRCSAARRKYPARAVRNKRGDP